MEQESQEGLVTVEKDFNRYVALAIVGDAERNPVKSNTTIFIVLCLIWGMTWVGIKAGIAVVPPLMFAGTPFAIAGLLILGIACLRGKLPRVTRRDWPRLLLVTLLMIPLCYGPLFWGMPTSIPAPRRCWSYPLHRWRCSLLRFFWVTNNMTVVGSLQFCWASSDSASCLHPKSIRAGLPPTVMAPHSVFLVPLQSLPQR